MNTVKSTVLIRILFAAAIALIIWMIAAEKVFAHCDTMNGPIIPEAKAALDKGDVTPILKWVKSENEGEIRAAFARAVVVRAQGAEAKELADQFFLETLIRLHRAGEGAPYTGLKDEPAEPITLVADKALAEGSIDEMIEAICRHMTKAVKENFDKVLEARKSKDESVHAGREFVEAYVTYMHHVEGIHNAVISVSGHSHEADAEGSIEQEKDSEHRH